ncbi:MAG: sulfate/thiosulfate transport system substrate-binding protein [Actinomycetota bacterium]|nr:sulfate/thiosulfate transport system substrate-binding protein [Actinomycetota bacterium]
MQRRSARLVSTLTLLTAMAVAFAACGSSSKSNTSGTSGGSGSTTLSLVAYSTPQTAFDAIIKEYQKTAAGKNIKFTESYGASGDQSRAVVSGLETDVANFSLAPDMARLVKAGIVDASWNSGPTKGILTNSVVVLAVRKGNPKNIRTWADLIKPGVQVITPNPFTSGGARWNIMAAYGAQLKQGKTAEQAVAYLEALFKNVPVQDDSARKALQTFTGGKGDVLLSYENDAIFAKQKQQAIDYVIPDQTILIESPAAVTKTSKHAAEANAFLQYLYTPAAQRIFADNGYRPVVAGVAKADEFKNPPVLFKITDLGGWTEVTDKFFDPDKGIVAGIEKGIGVSTSK